MTTSLDPSEPLMGGMSRNHEAVARHTRLGLVPGTSREAEPQGAASDREPGKRVVFVADFDLGSSSVVSPRQAEVETELPGVDRPGVRPGAPPRGAVQLRGRAGGLPNSTSTG